MRFWHILILLLAMSLGAAERPDAVKAMRRAATFFYEEVALHGGYVYYYSPDLTQRLGEGVAGEHEIWVQPPGTPTVCIAFVDAYDATGDAYYLQAAQAAAEALVYGQLRSGGWSNRIDCRGIELGGERRRDGNSSLDDGQSQAAIRCLIRVDQALKFRHRAIHEAATFALDSLLAAQFANGGFPQVWRRPVEPQPVLKASYPGYDWRREGRIKNYWDMYTINDNVCGFVAEALILAHTVYGEERFQSSLQRLGDFLLRAQMPAPQPAWAQQYNYQMHPIWARAFEPPAISGGESQDVIATLMTIAEATRDPRFLAPIPKALSYLRHSRLPDGRLARYYELQSNRPLYMLRTGKKTYALSHDDSKLPKHYAFKVDSRLDALDARYLALRRGKALRESGEDEPVAEIIADLDVRGRWISRYASERLVGQPKFAPGQTYISSAVFSRRLTVLARLVAR